MANNDDSENRSSSAPNVVIKMMTVAHLSRPLGIMSSPVQSVESDPPPPSQAENNQSESTSGQESSGEKK